MQGEPRRYLFGKYVFERVGDGSVRLRLPSG